jgi:hypothetical protein
MRLPDAVKAFGSTAMSEGRSIAARLNVNFNDDVDVTNFTDTIKQRFVANAVSDERRAELTA